MDFNVVGEVAGIETLVAGAGARERAHLRKQYGRGRWCKQKSVASIRLADGVVRLAEVHWYEAHGIGKRELKLKLPFLDRR